MLGCWYIQHARVHTARVRGRSETSAPGADWLEVRFAAAPLNVMLVQEPSETSHIMCVPITVVFTQGSHVGVGKDMSPEEAEL